MHPRLELLQTATRRHFLTQSTAGLGGVALASLLHGNATCQSAVAKSPENGPNPLAAKPSLYAAKAKRVIYLHMTGSPPNLDMYDYKPELVRLDGEDCPADGV